MDTWLVVLILGIVLFVGWRYSKRAKRAGERATALSKYGKQFSLIESRQLHDMAVTYLATSIQQGRDPNQDLEIAVALRDRIDELEQRPHGPANKARIRSSISPTMARLFRENNPLVAIGAMKLFKVGEDTPDTQHRLLNLHLQMMQRVYQHLDKAPHLPELDEFASRQ